MSSRLLEFHFDRRFRDSMFHVQLNCYVGAEHKNVGAWPWCVCLAYCPAFCRVQCLFWPVLPVHICCRVRWYVVTSRGTKNPRLEIKSYNWRIRWNIDCWGSISNVIKIPYIHTQYVPSTTGSALSLACGEHKLGIMIAITIMQNSDMKYWTSSS